MKGAPLGTWILILNIMEVEKYKNEVNTSKVRLLMKGYTFLTQGLAFVATDPYSRGKYFTNPNPSSLSLPLSLPLHLPEALVNFIAWGRAKARARAR